MPQPSKYQPVKRQLEKLLKNHDDIISILLKQGSSRKIDNLIKSLILNFVSKCISMEEFINETLRIIPVAHDIKYYLIIFFEEQYERLKKSGNEKDIKEADLSNPSMENLYEVKVKISERLAKKVADGDKSLGTADAKLLTLQRETYRNQVNSVYITTFTTISELSMLLGNISGVLNNYIMMLDLDPNLFEGDNTRFEQRIEILFREGNKDIGEKLEIWNSWVANYYSPVGEPFFDDKFISINDNKQSAIQLMKKLRIFCFNISDFVENIEVKSDEQNDFLNYYHDALPFSVSGKYFNNYFPKNFENYVNDVSTQIIKFFNEYVSLPDIAFVDGDRLQNKENKERDIESYIINKIKEENHKISNYQSGKLSDLSKEEKSRLEGLFVPRIKYNVPQYLAQPLEKAYIDYFCGFYYSFLALEINKIGFEKPDLKGTKKKKDPIEAEEVFDFHVKNKDFLMISNDLRFNGKPMSIDYLYFHPLFVEHLINFYQMVMDVLNPGLGLINPDKRIEQLTGQVKTSEIEKDELRRSQGFEWANIVAHEVRGSIEAIRTDVSGLEKYLDDNDLLENYTVDIKKIKSVQNKENFKVESIIKNMDKSAKEISNLVKKVNEHGKLSKPKLANHPAKDFENAISKIFNKIEEDSGIQLNVLIGDFDFVCDKAQINQVFRNLIENSIKYAFENYDKEKSISIKISKTASGESDEVYIEYSNTGNMLSITENQYWKKFSRSDKEKGTGLGMSIVKEIINNHEGRVKLDPSSFESGHKLDIWIPLNRVQDNEDNR